MKVMISTLVFTFLVSGIAAAEKSEVEIYVVKKGESLYSISNDKYGVDNLWPQLAAYNQIKDTNTLRAGEKIVVPTESDLLIKANKMKSLKRSILYQADYEGIKPGEKPAGWEFPSGGTWGITHAGTRVLEQSKHNVGNCAAITGDDRWSNYTVETAIKIEHSGDGGIFAYWQSNYANYRLRVLNHNRVELVKREPTGPKRCKTISIDAVPFSLKDSVWYIFKLEVTNRKACTYLKGKLWEKGTSEPGTWMLEASDYSSERYINGKAGLWTNQHGPSYRGAEFDNFNVCR